MKHKYTILHIPTGTRYQRETDTEMTRQEFLTMLDAWNSQMPGIWQYWSN